MARKRKRRLSGTEVEALESAEKYARRQCMFHEGKEGACLHGVSLVVDKTKELLKKKGS